MFATSKKKTNKKANIMFLVMFIMFVSSLLGLLVSQYVQYMVRTASIFQNYYATYYLTYGGIELGLTQVKYHGYGFESTETFTGASCRSLDCLVTVTVTARSSVIADTYDQWESCPDLSTSGSTNNSYMTLGSGDCFIVPLYYDTASGFDAISYTKIEETSFLNVSEYNPTLYNVYSGAGGTGEAYSLRIIDESLNNLDSILEPTTESPTPYAFSEDMFDYDGSENNYLIIANPTNTSKSFCLELEDSYELPMNYVNVESIGVDGNATVSLYALKNNSLPSFLCYGAINP